MKITCICGKEVEKKDDMDFVCNGSGWGGPVCSHETMLDTFMGPIVLFGIFGGGAVVFHAISYFTN